MKSIGRTLAIFIILITTAASPVAAQPPLTHFTIVAMDGTEYSQMVEGEENWTGYNYTVEAASLLNISSNLTEDPNWGWYLNDLFGATTDEQLDVVIKGLDIDLSDEVMEEISLVYKNYALTF